MNCVFCGGKLEKRNVAFHYEEDSNYFFVEDVPAEVCTSCGEKTYSPEVTDKLLKYATEEREPTKTIEVPVFSFE